MTKREKKDEYVKPEVQPLENIQGELSAGDLETVTGGGPDGSPCCMTGQGAAGECYQGYAGPSQT